MIHNPAGNRPHRKRRESGMIREHSETERESKLRFIQVPISHQEESLASAVIQGLSKPQKELPSRFFYDIEGSRLFEQITRLPEYYLTRCETEILARYSPEIVAASGPCLQVVEFGSGSSEKTRLLLRAAVHGRSSVEYVPIDISSEFLRDSSDELVDAVDGVFVTALAGDYLDSLKAIPDHDSGRLFLFLGSTIGNFLREEAVEFLTQVRLTMRPQDRLLVGVDLKKAPALVEPAYNDVEGVTELFNKNILARINRELCGKFDLGSFAHAAPWVEESSRIEMRLVSKINQVVAIDGLDRAFSFKKGEYIHTENSHKWCAGTFAQICRDAGLSTRSTWLDSKGWFALNLLAIEC